MSGSLAKITRKCVHKAGMQLLHLRRFLYGRVGAGTRDGGYHSLSRLRRQLPRQRKPRTEDDARKRRPRHSAAVSEGRALRMRRTPLRVERAKNGVQRLCCRIYKGDFGQLPEKKRPRKRWDHPGAFCGFIMFSCSRQIAGVGATLRCIRSAPCKRTEPESCAAEGSVLQ